VGRGPRISVQGLVRPVDRHDLCRWRLLDHLPRIPARNHPISRTDQVEHGLRAFAQASSCIKRQNGPRAGRQDPDGNTSPRCCLVTAETLQSSGGCAVRLVRWRIQFDLVLLHTSSAPRGNDMRLSSTEVLFLARVSMQTCQL